MSLDWLPDVLTAAGLRVALVDGWETRKRPGAFGPIIGVICHHTAGPLHGNMPSLNTLINGRPDLSGPLSQIGLGRDGTFYIVAAGRCNHAGAGSFHGQADIGNSQCIGIEAENTGLPNDSPWPAVQVEAYAQGVAAILRHIGKDVDACVAHKEYAPDRKDDPDFDMDAFREKVAGILNGTTPAPTPIPGADAQGHATVKRGSTGADVRLVQKAVGVAQDGNFGPKTEAAVRQFQRDHGLVPDGIVGPKSWAIILA